MTKNLVLGPILVPLSEMLAQKIFSWILPLLHARHYCKLSLYAISRKTNEPNLMKLMDQTNEPLCPKFGPKMFFREFYLY